MAGGGCCGALPYHLDEQERALEIARRNIDAWWPHIERGAEAVVVTASGCGVMVREYGHLLRQDAAYAKKAKRVSELARDPVEVVAAEWSRIAPKIAMDLGSRKVAFHAPCTLQHGLKLKGRVEEILHALGLELTPVPDAHLCCGSAGTYSILQPTISKELKRAKLAALGLGRARRDRIGEHRLHHAPRRWRQGARYATGSSSSTRGWLAADRARRCDSR